MLFKLKRPVKFFNYHFTKIASRRPQFTLNTRNLLKSNISNNFIFMSLIIFLCFQQKCKQQPRDDLCPKYKISDFPTIIDRFIPRDEMQKQGVLTTEYRDTFSRIGEIIIKYKIHDHTKCHKVKFCQHPLYLLGRKKKMF